MTLGVWLEPNANPSTAPTLVEEAAGELVAGKDFSKQLIGMLGPQAVREHFADCDSSPDSAGRGEQLIDGSCDAIPTG